MTVEEVMKEIQQDVAQRAELNNKQKRDLIKYIETIEKKLLKESDKRNRRVDKAKKSGNWNNAAKLLRKNLGANECLLECRLELVDHKISLLQQMEKHALLNVFYAEREVITAEQNVLDVEKNHYLGHYRNHSDEDIANVLKENRTPAIRPLHEEDVTKAKEKLRAAKKLKAKQNPTRSLIVSFFTNLFSQLTKKLTSIRSIFKSIPTAEVVQTQNSIPTAEFVGNYDKSERQIVRAKPYCNTSNKSEKTVGSTSLLKTNSSRKTKF